MPNALYKEPAFNESEQKVSWDTKSFSKMSELDRLETLQKAYISYFLQNLDEEPTEEGIKEKIDIMKQTLPLIKSLDSEGDESPKVRMVAGNLVATGLNYFVCKTGIFPMRIHNKFLESLGDKNFKVVKATSENFVRLLRHIKSSGNLVLLKSLVPSFESAMRNYLSPNFDSYRSEVLENISDILPSVNKNE